MTRKFKVMVSVMIALAILITGSAATVMAQDEPSETETESIKVPGFGGNGLMPKVAELLGMTPGELADVFKQAQQELSGEVFIDYVNQAVEEGIISAEDAEAIITWWQNRPESVNRLFSCPGISRSIRSRNMRMRSFSSMQGLSDKQGNTEQVKLRIRNRLSDSANTESRVRLQRITRSQNQIAVTDRIQVRNVLKATD